MSDAVVVPPPGAAAGQPLVTLHQGDLDTEYAALHRGALLVDRSQRARWQFPGARGREMIAGLVTNDVANLEAGHGCYAAALTHRGKIVADVRIFALPDAVMVDVPQRAAAGWEQIVRKFINPRITPYVDVSTSVADVGVFGVRAAHIVATATGMSPDALLALPPYGHVTGAVHGTGGSTVPVQIIRAPDIGVEGFDLFVAAEARSHVWARMQEGGAAPGSVATLDLARVESGRPEWGLDMDDTTIPQEANFDALGAISYTKGCYTGQETVARLHFRGHVNRYLRGLRFAPAAVIPPRQSPLIDAEGKPVGEVRSGVRSPRFGLIALGMIRREVPSGATLIARWDATDGRAAGETLATVADLPFGN